MRYNNKHDEESFLYMLNVLSNPTLMNIAKRHATIAIELAISYETIDFTNTFKPTSVSFDKSNNKVQPKSLVEFLVSSPSNMWYFY